MDICTLGVCMIAAGITNLEVNKPDLPTSAYSYDGIERDISKFYTPNNDQKSIDTVFYLDSDTKIDLGYDTGYKTSKLTVKPTLSVGVTQKLELTDALSVTLSGSTSIGGESKHTSCKDIFDREYFCGNLSAWSDFKPQKHENNTHVSVNFNYKF